MPFVAVSALVFVCLRDVERGGDGDRIVGGDGQDSETECDTEDKKSAEYAMETFHGIAFRSEFGDRNIARDFLIVT